MKLTIAQKRQMYENGYLHIPGVVPPVMVAEAVKAINHSIGTRGIPPNACHRVSFCPEVQGASVITDLFNKTPMKSFVESLMEPGVVPDIDSGQTALRYPAYPDQAQIEGPHIDGVHSYDKDGKPDGQIHHFTMLAAVFLSDLSQPFCGNFTVWPGAHRWFEKYAREHGPMSLSKALPPFPRPEPVQILARPGDVVLAHYMLPHSVAANVSPHIRYASFFRVSHADHDKFGFDCMTRIWAEWAGMRDVVPAEEQSPIPELTAAR